MPNKVLIANRGEIAVRIARSCREMGIRTVAIYSAVDGSSLHVQAADESCLVGPAPAVESYLSIPAILAVAAVSGADAVHPGYGFLAENAEFAQAVTGAGLLWIGPPVAAIELLGDKVASKKLARSVNVPTVPGYDGEDQSVERMQSEAGAIGYPVMLKASAGGGGKGMRAVSVAEDMGAALEGAKREARSSFGNGRVFLEKLIVDPRHVEIQVMVDSYGNAVYLGERDCSAQRRHQKVIEEAPSPVMTPALRAAMGADAVRLARAAGYVNAGTVEFLFSDDSYYFLEVNTRIQVEHPVTEMITGFDLIRLQIEIASGEHLPFSQTDVHLSGHAIEARLYAEDPARKFMPSSGVIADFSPPNGVGIRNDVGVYAGATVTPYYDPMLAKLIVHAETRDVAMLRLRAALDRYRLSGLVTNIDFLRWIVDSTEFACGRVDIGFVDRSWRPDSDVEIPGDVLVAAAAFQAMGGCSHGDTEVLSRGPWDAGSGWRMTGMPRTFRYRYGDSSQSVSVTARGSRFTSASGDWTSEFEIESGPSPLILRFDGRVLRFDVTATPESFEIQTQGSSWVLRTQMEDSVSTGGAGNQRRAVAPMPGTIVKVAVKAGQQVGAHEPLVVLEAMKMEHVVEAPREGVIAEVLVREGELVPAGTEVVRMEDT